MDKISFENIKLVIFDLDNTIWDGLLSEEDISLYPFVKEAFECLVDNGVVISVCSKNDYSKAKDALIKFGLWEYIVFPSIDWNPKGLRIKNILAKMGLRDANTLFVDDQTENCREATFYNKNIKTFVANKKIFEEIVSLYFNLPKKDSNRVKLKQYKELEIRENSRIEYQSNEEFLNDSMIEIIIKENCNDVFDRILEMVHKTNQLNFTKIRSSKEELESDISNAYSCGVISVKDKYSNYGLVGFYLLDKPNHLKHFLFSCRTIGMGVEQFVYEYLKFPLINVIDPVSAKLENRNNLSPWIHLVKDFKTESVKTKNNKTRILMKGPCDLEVISGYLESTGSHIDVEFTFQDKSGRSVEHQNSIINIVTFDSLSKERKSDIIENAPFGHEALDKTRMFDNNYDVVILSCFTDFTIPMYQNTKNGYLYSCGQYGFPLTDEKNWDGYISGKIYNGNFHLSINQLEQFSKEYKYVGVNVLEIFKGIKYIREKLNRNTILILTLGSDIPYENETNPVYFNAAKLHRQFHELLINNPIDGVYFVDVNPIINKLGQSAFTNNINHFCKQVYIDSAQQIAKIIEEHNFNSFKIKKNRSAFIAKIRRHLRKVFNRK